MIDLITFCFVIGYWSQFPYQCYIFIFLQKHMTILNPAVTSTWRQHWGYDFVSKLSTILGQTPLQYSYIMEPVAACWLMCAARQRCEHSDEAHALWVLSAYIYTVHLCFIHSHDDRLMEEWSENNWHEHCTLPYVVLLYHYIPQCQFHFAPLAGAAVLARPYFLIR